MVKSRRGLSGVERGQGIFVTSGKKKGSVRRETNVVSGMRVTMVQNRHQKPRHPLGHQLQKHEVEVTSEAEASLGSSIDSRAKTRERYLH